MQKYTTYTGTPNKLLPSAAAIIYNDDRSKILLQRRGDNGYWGFPGGGLEMGESLAENCIREVFEETGYRVEILRLVGIYSDPRQTTVAYSSGDIVQYISALFECRITGGSPTLCDETTALDWFDPRQPPQPFVPNHLPRLADALAGQTAAFFR